MTVTQDVERGRDVAAGIDVIIDLTARRLAFEMDAGGVLRGVFAAALPRVGDTRHFALSVFGKVKNNGVAASGKDALRKGCHFAVRCGFAFSEERHAGRDARYLTGSEFEIRKGAGRRDIQS